MGKIFHGIPPELALFLQKKYNLKVFVETGTLVGETALWAATRFDKVFTIECADVYYKIATEKLSKYPNVKVIQGDSSRALLPVLKNIQQLALIWLDAHYSSDLEYRKPSRVSPVLDELAIIFDCNPGNVVLIDDARLFDTTTGWVSLKTITGLLKKSYQDVEIIDDVIVATPKD
jgi:predicted O-methyltransferase YrrM